MKHIALTWLVAFGVALFAQSRQDSIRPVTKNDQTELQDKNGEVRFWLDEWLRTHSPDLIERQQRYNKIVRSYFGSFIGGGLSARYDSMELLSAQPPGRRGINGNNFALPINIREDGTFDDDTIFLTFFQYGAEWDSEAHYMESDCASVSKKIPAINCAQYKINWGSSSEPIRAFANDPFAYGARYQAMQKGLAALRRLQALMPQVETVTASGARSNSTSDTQQYAQRNAECIRQSFGNLCSLDAKSMVHPFDWMTAQVDAAKLTPAFRKDLQNAELDARSALSSAESLREVTQSAVAAAKQ